MDTPTVSRSELHALTPIGLDTPQVESLTGYFCRLAYSHAMTATQLAGWILGRFGERVPDDFKWCQRSFASHGVRTEQWAAWMSELAGVGELDRLTLVPWRHLVSGQGLAPKSDRWCRECLLEDRNSGAEPYLRLVWDAAPVTVCARHKIQLEKCCPHCGRANVRNRASIVVPGYCTVCGGFLGDGPAIPATPEALWAARQVGMMLAIRPTVAPGGTKELLQEIITEMAGGQAATFARHLGFSKSGVWHWVTNGGVPSLSAWLTISLHGGIAVERLFRGDLDGWAPTHWKLQLDLPLADSPRKGIVARVLDWEEIRTELKRILELPEPIPLKDACERVGVDYKHMHLRANMEARAIADRFRLHRQVLKQRQEAALRQQVSEILDERLAAGYEGLSARDVWDRIGPELKALRGTYGQIRTVRDER